jgi:endonuclease/exonuclease/phosphatase family metal-dependent hydrolase
VRKIQFQQIAEIIKSRQGPIILAGDFNEAGESPFEMLLRETSLKHSCSAKTFPSWRPQHAFDRILLSKEFTPTDQFVPEGPKLSDHLPLVVKTEPE